MEKGRGGITCRAFFFANREGSLFRRLLGSQMALNCAASTARLRTDVQSSGAKPASISIPVAAAIRQRAFIVHCAEVGGSRWREAIITR